MITTDELERLQEEALRALEALDSEEALRAWHAGYLGRRSRLMETFAMLGTLPKDQRPIIGRRANEVKEALEAAYAARLEAVRQAALRRELEAPPLDITLPGRPVRAGRLHPATQTLREIVAIFAEMGFQVFTSRDVETDEYNFQLLNIPPHHPARDMWSTFYTDREGVILRTHTSPGQIHAMRAFCPDPVRVILPGMCYRYEQITARSEIMFHQVEGLAVGARVTMSDLKGTLADFARRMFGPERRVRFRPSYFPFTEPSVEVDIDCILCEGRGCRVCKFTGWLEIAGAGMVHPIVLENGGYDPRRFTGFAFGMGPQRITMLKHRIDDIRYFWSNDLRFLEQFG
ncbi:MAG: phenylalanine--tRNA ligase subunit alpha [Anaerolineae bacterium]|uniref:phenylalanine--tRNA ligase subunit alpha n=1 Tax=Thermoflexus sp. TaxID=1969742 RepID=UPI0025DC2E3C|nr:phenylalanine--tRNA ligase subunit alpha [Thermoflexus sp.]MCS7350831.1 phenylalanine--tRNA ligase subunit alpha [Thermoflexus sp.]MDW8180282.1 phenylalanine--tRNA ligase subunit alpha [Anaerolineae bacterium]